MKVICDAPGQTCNRLWTYVSILSECIVKKKKMIIIFFDYTIEYFPQFKECKYIYFPLYNKKYLEYRNGWNNYKGLSWKVTHNKYWKYIFKKLGFINGWSTRNDTKYINQAKAELKNIFTPQIDIINQTNDLWKKNVMKDNIVIGVHIRRGDYSTWNDGKYFFSIHDYHQFMIRIKELFKNEKIIFFISSNEEINLLDFQECNCFISNSNNPIVDLYSLSLCDYIIGPYSTFSRWASFYGEKPLCFLENKDQQFSKSSFSKVIDFFHFENGNIIPDL